MNRDKVILESTRYMRLSEIASGGLVTGAMWRRYTGAVRHGERKCDVCELVKSEKHQFSYDWSTSCEECTKATNKRFLIAKEKLTKIKRERCL